MCRDLALTLGPYVGTGQYAPIVDRPTGVDLDSPLIIFDLEDLDEQMYAFAIFAATEAVDRRAKRRSAREGTEPRRGAGGPGDRRGLVHPEVCWRGRVD